MAERTAELTCANEALRRSNQELEAFSYSVSHDLRAPLRGIDGFSQALLEDYAAVLDAPGQAYLQRVRAASQRMGQLIDDLLNLSRLSRRELRPEAVDLSALAGKIAAELRESQPERAVTFEIAAGLVVNGDASLLRVALENLLTNAWKFTGRTRDVCRNEPLDEKFRAFGWTVKSVNGHDYAALTEVLTQRTGNGQPTCIIANTVKGKGVSFMEDVAKWHHGVQSEAELKQALAELDAAEAKLAIEKR